MKFVFAPNTDWYLRTTSIFRSFYAMTYNRGLQSSHFVKMIHSAVGWSILIFSVRLSLPSTFTAEG